VLQIPRTVAILRLVWMVLCLAVLLYCQYAFDGQPNSDSEEVLIIMMFVLSFPASFLAGGFAVAVAFVWERFLHVPLHTGRLEMLFVWSLFSVLGYLQWFALVPRMWSKWKNRGAARTGGLGFTSEHKDRVRR